MRQGVNTSSGVFTGQTDYSAFGEVVGGNNTGASQSVYQWGAQSGYRMDGGSGGGGDCGLVKVGARYYDPAVGRFTSRDSDVAEPAYAYCWGDPINFTDDSGDNPAALVALAARVGGGILTFGGGPIDPAALGLAVVATVGVLVVGGIILATKNQLEQKKIREGIRARGGNPTKANQEKVHREIGSQKIPGGDKGEVRNPDLPWSEVEVIMNELFGPVGGDSTTQPKPNPRNY